MKKIASYLKPYVPRMLLGFGIKFTGTIIDLFIPWILAYMIDNIVPQKNVPLVLAWGAAMLACAFGAMITNIIANRMASKVARDSTERIRHDLFEKVLLLSEGQTDEFTIPSLVSRLTSDTYNLHNAIGMMQRLGVRAPILILGGIIVTLILEPVLAMVLILLMPLMAFVVYFFSKKGIPLYSKLQQNVDKLVRVIRENITGIRVIKALSKTEYEKERFGGVNSEVSDSEKKASLTMAITDPIMNFLLNMGLVLVVLIGAFRVNAGLTKTGEIIAFLTYFTIILTAIMTVTRLFVMYTKAVASAKRISAVLEAPDDLAVEEILSNSAFNEDEKEHISFENVSFSYLKSKNNLENISFELKKGETLGIIGATGAGKSTILKLLMRLYDPDEGSIKIDGRDLRSIPESELRSKFGVVFQNDTVFADTVYENIDFGRGLPKENIISAANFAQAEEFINSLGDGYDAQISAKGSNLSGGQKQRLLIARALAGKPEILLLDDSSSALDYATDARLRKSLHENFKDTTKIIVAQRISSIMHAEKIIMLDDGKVAGMGTHEELLENCEIYREIYASQMGGEIADAIRNEYAGNKRFG